jgi:hypothetical protein
MGYGQVNRQKPLTSFADYTCTHNFPGKSQRFQEVHPVKNPIATQSPIPIRDFRDGVTFSTPERWDRLWLVFAWRIPYGMGPAGPWRS